MNRRTLLQALGLTAASGFVSGPFAHAQTRGRPRRVIFVMSELGWVPKDWRMRPPGSPESLLHGSRYHPDNRTVPDDAKWEFKFSDVPTNGWSPGLEPYRGLSDSLTAIDGLGMCSIGTDQFGDGHAMGYLGIMSGAPSAPESPAMFDTLQKSQASRPSIDQLIKNHLRATERGLTDLTSLELRVTPWQGGLDGNNFHNFIYDWDAAAPGKTFRVKAQSNPLTVFDRLFPTTGSMTDPVRAGRPDVMNFVTERYAKLRPQLSKADQLKLEAHRSLVAGVQARISAIANVQCRKPSRPPRPNVPQGSAELYTWNANTMIDLIVASMSCDLTRVATLQLPFPPASLLQNDAAHDPHHWYSHNSDPTRQWLGVPGSTITPDANEEFLDAHAGLTRKMRHQAALVASLAQKLKDTPDGEGQNLLDNTLIVFADEISHGSHGHDQLPVVLLGKGGGAVRPGRYIRLPRTNPNPGISSMGEYVGQPVSHLLISTAQMMGVPLDDLGPRSVVGRVNQGPLRGLTKSIPLTGPLRELG